MSAPFPSRPVQSIGYRPRLDQLMTPRGIHIPSWYDPSMHENPEEIVVKQDDIPILAMDGRSFTVAEVPVERRWSIRSDGNILDKATYFSGCHRIINDFYALLKQENPSIKFEGSVEKEPICPIRDYVSLMVDPDNEERLIPMHYDSNATLGAVPESLASTKTGDVQFKPRLDSLLESYANPTARGAMTDREIEEVKAHFRGLESQSVDVSPPEKSEKKSKARSKMTMACGQEIYKFHKAQHLEKCEECRKE